MPPTSLQSNRRFGLRLAFALAAASWAGADGAEPTPGTASGGVAAESDAFYEFGRLMFEQLATPELRAQFEFPTRERWNAFAVRFDRALAGDSLEDLAALAAETRDALTALRTVPGFEDLADWLEQRLDAIEGAQQATRPKPPLPPVRPGVPLPPASYQPVPHYDLWLARVRARPAPTRAAALLPVLRAAFAKEGVPAELVWLAEAESSFNPSARSPVGAKGLFQFMPETAKAMGLGTFLPDERTDPAKSAQAAARYLKYLHGRFGNWALALAAYNAGEGRVARTLAAKRATSFTAIADALPAETRMYVPKVCALVAVRGGLAPERIPAPR
jgi:membrane-bound lytic murein transglycosylase D